MKNNKYLLIAAAIIPVLVVMAWRNFWDFLLLQ